MARGPWLLLSLSHGVATGHLCLEVMSSRCSLVGPSEGQRWILTVYPSTLELWPQDCDSRLTVALLLPLPASSPFCTWLIEEASSRSPVSHSGGPNLSLQGSPHAQCDGPQHLCLHIPPTLLHWQFQKHSQHSHLRASVLAGPLPWNILSPVTQTAPTLISFRIHLHSEVFASHPLGPLNSPSLVNFSP